MCSNYYYKIGDGQRERPVHGHLRNLEVRWRARGTGRVEDRSRPRRSARVHLEMPAREEMLDKWSRSKRPRIHVKFADESGYGEGVTRDWIASVLTALYAPEMGVFGQVAHRVVHPRKDIEATSKWAWLAGLVTGIASRANVSTGYHLSDAFLSSVLARRPADPTAEGDRRGSRVDLQEGVGGESRRSRFDGSHVRLRGPRAPSRLRGTPGDAAQQRSVRQARLGQNMRDRRGRPMRDFDRQGVQMSKNLKSPSRQVANNFERLATLRKTLGD